MSDDTALQEQIALAIYGAHTHLLFPDELDEAPKWLQEVVRSDAAAVLPLIHAEIERAKAQVLRDAAPLMHDYHDEAWLNSEAYEIEKRNNL